MTSTLDLTNAPSATLHVIDTGGPGGAETVFAEIAARLDGAPLKSVPIVPREGWLAAQLRVRGLEPHVLPCAGAMNIGYLRRLASVARARNVRVVHAHLLGSSVYAALLSLVLGIPVIGVFHGPSDFAGPQRLLPLKRWLLRRCGAVVAVSQSTKRALIEFGIDAEHIELIRNGVDTQRFFPDRTGALREELGLKAHESLVGAVGNVRGPKDYETLLRSARVVVDAHPAVHFAVVGEGEQQQVDRLVALRNDLGLTGRFHFLGFRRAERTLFSDFDVFVSSSSSEGLPLSFLEAMACGVCVVATESGGAQEVVSHEATGLLAPIKDPEALGRALLSVLADPNLRTALAAAGRERVIQEFSLEGTIERYKALYARLLQRRQA
jgi:glycosyltransferase involved in cell wall biosynthesis